MPIKAEHFFFCFFTGILTLSHPVTCCARVRNNGRSSVMTGRILGMTCQVIGIYIVCPVIYFGHIHNSLLHYIIIAVIIEEVLSGFIYFLTIEKIFLCYCIFSYCNVWYPSLRSSRSQTFFKIGVLKNSQYIQENICAGSSFWMPSGLQRY